MIRDYVFTFFVLLGRNDKCRITIYHFEELKEFYKLVGPQGSDKLSEFLRIFEKLIFYFEVVPQT